jgi:molybdopterin molybdotransferase
MVVRHGRGDAQDIQQTGRDDDPGLTAVGPRSGPATDVPPAAGAAPAGGGAGGAGPAGVSGPGSGPGAAARVRTQSMRQVAWASARTTAYAAAEALPARVVPLSEAGGCTLAAPLRGRTPLPAFDNSAMDGYAVGSESGPWRIVGQVLAGEMPHRAIASDEAMEIATGAPVPDGTVAVVTYELSQPAGPDSVDGTVPSGLNVRQRGEGAPLGIDLLPSGTPVSPTVLGLAAQVGLDNLVVRPRPTVAALLTGSEIIHSGASAHAQVRDGVGPQLPGLVSWLGGDLRHVGYIPDSPAAALGEAIEASGADIVLTCGSAAHGPADRLRDTLPRLGARLLVPSVAVRPGHPQQLALLADGRWLVGLPGNPYASVVAALTLLGPLIASLSGRGLPILPTARLDAPASVALEGVTRVLPARRRPDGTIGLAAGDRPANLWGAALADGLAVIRPGWTDDPVPVLALPPG